MDLSGLNKEQIEAVKHINGPMLVLAGAGSGKTRVLTNRIAYLIENDISGNNILAITFTNKAAKEMKDRVINLIGRDANYIQISTFHSLGLKIIKENCSLLVNVIANILYGFIPFSIRFAILLVNTLVLPEPAPARTSIGPSI